MTASDPDLPPDTLTYTLVGGADQALFSITAGGVLTFNTAPDFETPGDADLDGVYEVTVQVDDGNGGVDTQAISVTVTDANEAPVAVVDNIVTSEDTIFAGNVLTNDSDPETDPLTVTLINGAAYTPGVTVVLP